NTLIGLGHRHLDLEGRGAALDSPIHGWSHSTPELPQALAPIKSKLSTNSFRAAQPFIAAHVRLVANGELFALYSSRLWDLIPTTAHTASRCLQQHFSALAKREQDSD
ncbi:MAG: hypothetical protein OXL33_00370, partial [Chloroflexota bacterium]|nr:hypothetical protein [Chloroflexota bacterium]